MLTSSYFDLYLLLPSPDTVIFTHRTIIIL